MVTNIYMEVNSVLVLNEIFLELKIRRESNPDDNPF